MTESVTRKKSTDGKEPHKPNNITYKVWIDIKEYDEFSGCGYACDARGGELATFDKYGEAWDFADVIVRAYSTRRGPCDWSRNPDLAKTLSHRVADAIHAIVSYLWESERIDYENCPRQDRAKHIVRHLETVSRWLNLPSD